jgi:hypothetical protein
MTTLREARQKGTLDQFIREHEKDAPGDLDKLDDAIKRLDQGKSSKAPAASSERDRDD